MLYIFTLERELIILLMLRIFASSLALFFFTMSTIVGTIIIFKNNTIKITNTKLIFKTPFNKIPFMKKNQKISYENIWKFFSNENNQFPYTFIVLKDKKVIGISKSDIPSFESFLEILKMKIKIHSIDRWNYVKVKEYINIYITPLNKCGCINSNLFYRRSAESQNYYRVDLYPNLNSEPRIDTNVRE